MPGIDSDNGSEFIYHHLLRYCQQEQISFTCGRAWKKNDGCFVEQKVNRLYGQLRLYTNYFQPVMKLVSDERIGAKVKKRYDEPQTPYHRLLSTPGMSETTRQRLRAEYAILNPAQRKREITRLQDWLRTTAARCQRAKASATDHVLKNEAMLSRRAISAMSHPCRQPKNSL